MMKSVESQRRYLQPTEQTFEQGTQKLLNVVYEFTAWCGMQINVQKTYWLVLKNDKQRRKKEPAPLLTINGETL